MIRVTVMMLTQECRVRQINKIYDDGNDGDIDVPDGFRNHAVSEMRCKDVRTPCDRMRKQIENAR